MATFRPWFAHHAVRRDRKVLAFHNVSLTPELAGLVAASAASGRHGSASEVVRAALRAVARQGADAAHPLGSETKSA